MLSVSPCAVSYLITALKTSIVLERKTYEKAGGVVEEMLYNIKNVDSFANLDLKIKDSDNILINLILLIEKKLLN